MLLGLALDMEGRAGGELPIALNEPHATINATPDLVAFWDFSEATGTAKQAALGLGSFPLADAGATEVVLGSGGSLGGAFGDFGGSARLVLPSDSVGALDLGRTFGNAVTVVAWVRRDTSATGGFVGGMWQENDGDPRRQYGLFTDLPLYGGGDRVCGHVSRTGAASPNLPFSRDYSASKETMKLGKWHTIAFTYDGAFARSYLDGRFSAYPDYTEPGAPDGEGLSYSKNPYAFADGLNAGSAADFTVGAVLLSSGWGNYLDGQIAGLAVYARALTQGEVARLHRLSISGGVMVDFPLQPDRVANNNDRLAPAEEGWTSLQTATGTVTSGASASNNFTFINVGGQRYAFRGSQGAPSTSGAGMIFFETLGGVTTANLSSISLVLNNSSTADRLRFCVKIGTRWYATEASYACDAAHAAGGDWASAETKAHAFSGTAEGWRDMIVEPGSALSLGPVRSADLPSGEIVGVGLYSPSVPAGTVRFRDLRMVVA